MDLNQLAQSIIAMLVITAPPDPAKLIFFNAIVEREGVSRQKAAMKVSLIVASVLAIAAFGGSHIAEVLGIDLNAFSVVGGLIVAGMGFEMLYGGMPSKAQGQDTAAQGPDEASGLVMPMAIPLIAGPGAIVTAVTISTSRDTYGVYYSLAGALAVGLGCLISFQWLGGILAGLSSSTTALLTRIGGLLLATIGTQMLLGGLKKFFLE